jgi:hypothetical protein
MTENPQSVRSFLAHVNNIDIIVPRWYQVDANGNVQLPAALVFFGLCAIVITTIVSEFWKGLRASSRKLSQP